MSFKITWPWDYAAYAACFYGGWAGGGSPVIVGDYCWDKYVRLN